MREEISATLLTMKVCMQPPTTFAFLEESKREIQLLLTKMSYFFFSTPISVFLPLSSPPIFPPPKKIDEENEANLLAVLTETLDSIPVDEDGLPSFEALADGDVTNASDRSCPSSPDGSPRTSEPEEPSLVRPAADRPFQDPPINPALRSKHKSVPISDYWSCMSDTR